MTECGGKYLRKGEIMVLNKPNKNSAIPAVIAIAVIITVLTFFTRVCAADSELLNDAILARTTSE
jgi:hypothetical protein